MLEDEQPLPRSVLDEQVQRRIEVFNIAARMVSGLVLEHGLETYTNAGSILVNGYNVTKVDQHLDHILRVADWLLDTTEH